jgi:hypothetical protein
MLVAPTKKYVTFLRCNKQARCLMLVHTLSTADDKWLNVFTATNEHFRRPWCQQHGCLETCMHRYTSKH